MLRRRALWFPLLVALMALAGFTGAGSQAGTAPAGLNEPAVIRLYYGDASRLNAVAGELDIWEVHRDEGYAAARVKPAEYDWLVSLGYKVEVDAEKSALLGIQAPLDPRFYYYDDYYTNANGLYIIDFLQSTNAAHPDLTELLDIGDAWLGAVGGGYHRDQWVLRITNEDPAFGAIEDKPVFFLFANIHAREVATPELAMRYIRYLLDGYNGEGGYGVDADATWLVDRNVLYVLVMQNPDGHAVDEQDIGAYWRKNVDDDDGCNDPGSWGVDLNRNSSFFWGCCGGSSGDPCGETYRGPERGSEPETAAFQDFFASVMIDQNGPNGDDEYPPAAPDDANGIFLTLHSYADEILWPYAFNPGGAPNDAQLETIGRKLAYYNGFYPSGFLYTVDGSTDDWVYGKFGIAAYTFEVGPNSGYCGGFFPAYGCLDGIDGMPRNFWAENGPAFLYMHKIARTPYMTAYGPDASDVTVMPGLVPPGTPVELTASIADHRYGGDPLQPVAAAEYFVGAPGADGTGVPMAPADGGWGDLSEEVVATVDTASIPLGKHYILVHGQNDAGDWGPFSAVFLYVMEAGASPVIQGYVRDAALGTPLEATVAAGEFQAETDETGFYTMTVISGTYDVSATAVGYVSQIEEGVVAHDYEVVELDFDMFPFCTLFADDVESGNLGWTADPPWAITDEDAHSPTHSWTDSPGGDYGNNINISLTSPPLDLSEDGGISLTFWHKYLIQEYFDFGYVEYSTDGSTWTQVAVYNNEYPMDWTEETLPLPGLDNQPQAQIRYRLQTNFLITNDGWHIDDVTLTGAGPRCVLPVAAFSADPETGCQPLAVQFTDESSGPVLDWFWDFGDEIGTSTEQNPAYIYTTPGEFEVSLTVSNAYTSTTVTGTVEVYETPVAGFSFAPTVVHTDTIVQFTDESTGPIVEWLWDFGDGATSTDQNPTHTFVTAGTFPVTLIVTSESGCEDVAVEEVVVHELAEPHYYLYLPIAIRND